MSKSADVSTGVETNHTANSRSAWSIYKSIAVWAGKVLIWVNAVVLFVMTSIITIEVFLRYLFNATLQWSFEVSEYMLVALGFLGIAYIQYRKMHIKVDFIMEKSSMRVQAIVGVFTTLIALALFITLTYIGWQFAWEALATHAKSWTLMAIPMFPVRVMVPIGSLAMVLYLIVELVDNIGVLYRNLRAS